MRWLVVGLGVAWAAGSATAGSGPVPCADIRFVSDQPLAGGPRGIVVSDAGGQVSIPGLCDPVRARWRVRSDGSVLLKARWAACGNVIRVRLRMHYVEDCTTAEGVLRVRHLRRLTFTAVPSTCGDDFLDAGEDCELTTPCADAAMQCLDCQCVVAVSTTSTTTVTTVTTTTTTTTTLATTTTTSLAPTTTSTTLPGATTSTTTTTLASSTTTTTSTTSSSTTTLATTTTTTPTAPTTTSTTVTLPNTSTTTTTTLPGVTSTTTTTLASSTTTTTASPGSTTTTTLPGGLFEAPNPWNTDVSAYPVASESPTIIDALAAAGGWGAGDNLQIDFSMHLLHADGTTPFVTFTANPGYYTPDCDDSFPFPMPVGGAIEGQVGYTCNTATDDCHLLVVDAAAKRLYEMYQANFASTTLSTTCGLFWDLTKSYPANARGEQCTSADAAGFPIGAMLFTADEVAAGEIAHAIRFILPNARMRAGVYVHPASHAGSPSGGASLPPYGVRFRLRADFPMAPYSANEQVILRAMQQYGMLLSDGGNIALTAASDTYTTNKWGDLGIDSHSLFGVEVTDMEVVDLGPTIPITYDCVRNP